MMELMESPGVMETNEVCCKVKGSKQINPLLQSPSIFFYFYFFRMHEKSVTKWRRKKDRDRKKGICHLGVCIFIKIGQTPQLYRKIPLVNSDTCAII